MVWAPLEATSEVVLGCRWESERTHLRTDPTGDEAVGLYTHKLPPFLKGHQVSTPPKPLGGEAEKTSGVEAGSWQLLELSTVAAGRLTGPRDGTQGLWKLG